VFRITRILLTTNAGNEVRNQKKFDFNSIIKENVFTLGIIFCVHMKVNQEIR